MKKNFLMVAAAASMLAFTACSSNEEEVARGMEEDGAQSFVLQVASAGDGLTTRAGRPLYSSEAAQNIDEVKLVVYKTGDKSIVYEKTLTNWAGISKAYTTGGHGLQCTLSLKGDDKLAAGDYKVLAVGYTNTTTGTTYTYNPTLGSLTKGGNYAPITATTEAKAEEVFAGEIALKVETNKDLAFNSTVTLHRQVAGGFGYFKNIPAAVDNVTATTLRLVASAKNMGVEFKNFNSEFKDDKSTVKYIVNGVTPATPDNKTYFSDGATAAYEVYSIDLTKYFPNGDVNGDGIYNETGTDDWKNENTALNIVAGSVFAGEFIIPFAKVEAKNTMELQLLSEAGAIIKHWVVKIPAVDVASDKIAPEVSDTDAKIYNVVRNHMYNIGTKIANTENPTETPDVEVPEDLSKGQDIILKVNDNWELIHKMELE